MNRVVPGNTDKWHRRGRADRVEQCTDPFRTDRKPVLHVDQDRVESGVGHDLRGQRIAGERPRGAYGFSLAPELLDPVEAHSVSLLMSCQLSVVSCQLSVVSFGRRMWTE